MADRETQVFALFAGEKASDVGRERLALALAELDTLDVVNMTDGQIEEAARYLGAAFALNVATLRAGEVRVGSPRKSTVPARVHPHASSTDEGEIDGYRTRYYIPFDGSAESFGWSPSYEPDGRFWYEGSIAGDALVVTVPSAQIVIGDALRNAVQGTVALVENYLVAVRGDAEGWPIAARVSAELKERRTLAASAREAAEAVGLKWVNENQGKPTHWTTGSTSGNY